MDKEIKNTVETKPAFLKRFDSFQKDCKTYRWLEIIKNNYERMLKLIWREQEHFRIYSIHFSARGDIEPFTVNPHKTIPWRYIYDGLKAALKSVIEEMHEIEERNEIKESEYKKEQEPAILNKEDNTITKQFVLNQLFSLKGHIESGRSWEYIPLLDGLIKAISESIAVITPNEELLSEKPAEWSEEDENRHYYLCKLLRETWDKVDKGSCIDDAITWFEKLPERIFPHSWKPSEEQMDALDNAYKTLLGADHDLLLSLLIDLKKLL